MTKEELCECGHYASAHWNNGNSDIDSHCVLSVGCDCKVFVPAEGEVDEADREWPTHETSQVSYEVYP